MLLAFSSLKLAMPFIAAVLKTGSLSSKSSDKIGTASSLPIFPRAEAALPLMMEFSSESSATLIKKSLISGVCSSSKANIMFCFIISDFFSSSELSESKSSVRKTASSAFPIFPIAEIQRSLYSSCSSFKICLKKSMPSYISSSRM